MAFTFSVVVHPEKSYKSALDGINIWLNIVCPSLLPFFIGSELMVNLGIADILGILLEPVMRPVFNVPGSGSFPFVMSITSGYPVGPKIIAKMYNEKMCTREEGQRMLSFCSTSGPLFMIGAVGVGMLNAKGAGMIIALSHYAGAITVGLLFKYYGMKKTAQCTSFKKTNNKSILNILKSERRPLGILLSEAVKNSINSVLAIGGFIVLFSVIINIMASSGIIRVLSQIICILLYPFGVDKSLLSPISAGIFEITVGSKLIASSYAPVQQKIICISGIIAWSGLSIHAQAASMLSNTDLSINIYIFSKMLHSIFSAVFAYLFLKFAGSYAYLSSIETFLYKKELITKNPNILSSLISGSMNFLYSILLLCGIAFLCNMLYKIYKAFTHSFF